MCETTFPAFFDYFFQPFSTGSFFFPHTNTGGAPRSEGVLPVHQGALPGAPGTDPWGTKEGRQPPLDTRGTAPGRRDCQRTFWAKPASP